ncbi:MAG: 2,3-bisphosphoglycerate-independent phosphoglycerate mutase [Alphaproteobacteria bacterium]|nr:2,3-bisphosphoglycerate-independent phosphoglycerate mutase [Alphaproteobacteria bacterium]
MENKSKSPVVLCILDGWGIGPDTPYNAIHNAKPHYFNKLKETYPNSQLCTSGEEVGLPPEQMGNSEVGHMTIGSGRPIEQDILRINKLLSSGEFFNTPEMKKLVKKLKNSNNSCHLIGLVSDGGVHSHIDHTLEIASFLNDNQIHTHLHIITDGRDTLPQSGIKYIKTINSFAKNKDYVSISTISGRYYSMDRDQRYERTKQAYKTIVEGNNKTFDNPETAILNSYSNNINDEFVEPQSSKYYNGMKKNDAVLFSNFRSDRMRQMVSSIVMPSNIFQEFEKKDIALSYSLTMTSYSSDIGKYSDVILKNLSINNTLAKVLETNGMSQLRIAETEKYAHVTFFFNAGVETPCSNEERILINSPKVSTYDLKPEMSAYELTDKLIEEINSNKHDFIVVNYANADMVGHTGNYDATIKAIKHIDSCLERLTKTVLKKKGSILITADHGNAEVMFDKEKNSEYTSHTTNPVPLIFVDSELEKCNNNLSDGTLSDIAPTILSLFNIKQPQDMKGKNLLSKIYA